MSEADNAITRRAKEIASTAPTNSKPAEAEILLSIRLAIAEHTVTALERLVIDAAECAQDQTGTQVFHGRGIEDLIEETKRRIERGVLYGDPIEPVDVSTALDDGRYIGPVETRDERIARIGLARVEMDERITGLAVVYFK